MSALGGAVADFAYSIFGLRIASRLALPELAPAPAVPVATADAVIRYAAAPLAPGPDASQPHNRPPRIGPLHIEGDDVFLTVDKVARYRIRAGREITVDPFPAASDRNVRLFLLGSALGILCHQRGLLPLHANALVSGGTAIAFTGKSGIGKSTLAAHFQKCGYEILCDDVCVVSFDATGRPLAWPGLPRLKLWRDAAERFGHDHASLDRALDGADKYHVPCPAATSPGPFPLARLYVLGDAAHEEPVAPLTGADAVRAIIANTYRAETLRPLGLTEVNFRQAALVARHAQIFAAPRQRGFDRFAAEAARFERHFMSSARSREPGARMPSPLATPA